MPPIYDYLIVGAGLYGSCFAYFANKHGYKCLVIDKRQHIGGNLYCESTGKINVHKYGPHIFHTSNKEVWYFVNNFVEFNDFKNQPIANHKGKLYHLPFNMNTFYEVFGSVTPEEAIKSIKEDTPLIENITNLEEQAISMVGKKIYETLIKEYTEKQWGLSCKELPSDIIKRLPLRFSFNNNYFNDKYQGIPIGGYNKLINGLLKGSDVITNTDYFYDKEYWDAQAKTIVYTGRIDEFYNYKFGKLDYRSLRWETETLKKTSFQGNAIMNFTSKDVDYTRIIEHKYFENITDNDIEKIPYTVISKEYPVTMDKNTEPFYPINNKENNELYQKYKELADNEQNVIFGGRLAEYKYYDMAPIIEKIINFWKDKNEKE